MQKVYVIDSQAALEAFTAAESGRKTVSGGERCSLVLVILPGISCDLSIELDLEGEGSEAVLAGLYLCGADERVSLNITLRHNSPLCCSRQLFKGLVGGAAHSRFHGRIVVAQDAQKTEAYQENHNILLSESARVDSEPQLEIYADDVKCSHGATVGRLSEEEQFYMRSRGISEEEARTLQMISFVAPVLDLVEDASVRERLASGIEAAVRAL